jgi:import inner membrane translocase subunit TIM8
MDQPSSSLDQNVDLSKLSQKDKQELQQFIVNESQKARIQQCVFLLSPCPKLLKPPPISQ